VPGASLLALLDDITSVLDDVAALTKVATGKTAGVLGDDLALNAQQVAGVRAERELPVVWAVAKGSLVNKAILVPAALAISAFAPWAVTPLLMLGGLFLCFEGFEKIAHSFARAAAEDAPAPGDPSADPHAVERDKIRGAIRTDFILSAEIVVIALGTVAHAELTTRILVLVGIALLMTVGVYGLVAGIVKLDDLGLYLHRRGTALARAVGRGVLAFAPWLMKALSIAGTAAMFLVGGGILVHGLPLHLLPALGGGIDVLLTLLLDVVAGIVAGALTFAAVRVLQRLRSSRGPAQRQAADGDRDD